MTNEKYFIDIGKEGSQSLGQLDYCFNSSTQDFLLRTGLKKGMQVLEIGCGSGVMSVWIAKQIGDTGKIIAIENNENQLNAARKEAKLQGIKNIEFIFCSAYEIQSIKQSFDFVYCRFVLHHLHQPEQVIKNIFDILKPNGIYAAEEGIANFAFSYPFSSAWGHQYLKSKAPWIDLHNQRDGNIGIKMYAKLHAAQFKIIFTHIVHPLLTTREQKKLLLVGLEEMKTSFLEQGNSEKDWEYQQLEIEKIINNDSQIIGFYGSCQVAGIKS